MTPLHVATFEGCLRFKNRLVGVGRHPEPHRYFGPGGVEEAEAQCAEANRDLLAFIRPPVDPPAIRLTRDRRRGATPRPLETIRFDSPLPSGRAHNDRVVVRIRRPVRGDHPRKVVVFHHAIYQKYWVVWEWLLKDLLDRVPLAMMAGPNHYERTPPGEFPGESTCNPNPWLLFKAFRQWSWDHQATLGMLRGTCELEPAAVIGFSVGAFQSLLGASAGLFDLPIVSIASTNRYSHGVFRGSIGKGIREGMERMGIDEERLSRMTESIQLERHVSPLRGRPVLYVRGIHDRVDPPPSLDRLEAALQPTRSVKLPAGHASLFFHRSRIGDEILAFFREVGVL